MAGTTGLEPATSAVTGQRSNQLNYVPAINPSTALPGEPGDLPAERDVLPEASGQLNYVPGSGSWTLEARGWIVRPTVQPLVSSLWLQAWWAMSDSNGRPSRCKRDALPLS